jgi:succinoglycan biosynthesis transport protein ExoP
MNNISFTPDDRAPRALTGGPGEGPPEAEAARRLPIFTQYLRVAVRWKWLIVGSIAFALVIGVLITLLSTRQYTASTRLEINREATRVVNVDSVEPQSTPTDMEFYQTQYGLLESRSLAERVARKLQLSENADFLAMFGEEELATSLRTRAPQAVAERDERLRATVKILLDHVAVSPMRLSRLVDVSWTSPNAELSARIANAWAAAFIESNLERRFEATAYARHFLEGRLEQLRQRLEESERQLVTYASQQSLINIPMAGPENAGGRPQERSLTADTLAALNTALAEATADRIRAESRAHQRSGGAVAEALMNPAITEMRQRRAEAAAEYSRLMTQFEPGYPPAAALAAQVRQLDQSIAREEARVQSSLRSNYEDSLTRERTLNAQVEGLKQAFLDQRRRSIQYNIFQRDVDTNRELYNGLLQRYKEVGVAGGVGNNNVSIVDPARAPDRPSRPRPLINLALALLVGMALGVGLALLREQIDETITDPSDLEGRIGLPLLGTIPSVKDADPVNELRNPKSMLLEAYLSVQTSLTFSTDHGFPRSIAVTSTRPGEGKSTTAFALAYSLSRSGSRILLVDGDMRSPSVHSVVGLRNERGLSNFLSSSSKAEELIQRSEDFPFDVMTSGPQPPNAAELLRGGRLEELIKELLTKYDYVVVDSPPVMGLADAPLIANRVEGTVFVIEARGIKARLAQLAAARIRQARGRMLGTILTKFDSNRAHMGYGYYYGYGYGEEKS